MKNGEKDMLTIQPNFQSPAFNAKRKLTPEEIQARKEESEYKKAYNEMLEQKEEFENLSTVESIKNNKVAQNVIKGGAVVSAGILGGMATGWGSKKTIQAFKELSKKAPVQSIKKHIKAIGEFISNSVSTVKKKFLESDAYKMPANSIKKNWKKFGKTKIGKPVVKFLNKVGNGIKFVYNKVSEGIKYVTDKIRGVKKETWEKSAVNTVGVSGGVASGVTAMKENGEEN